VKRDKDLIRELLFEYEALDHYVIVREGGTSSSTDEEKKRRHHQDLMVDEGLLQALGRGSLRMTSYGHDYLDAIRDDTIWSSTKAGAAEIGGATLGMMKDFAVAYLRQKAADKLGISL